MKLVVLDINGVIARNQQRTGLTITKTGKSIVNDLSKKYQIGLYSSTTGPKVDRFVESSGVSDKFKFVFARDMTRPDRVLGGYATIKPLYLIFKYFPEYDYSNTIIVDDTPEKVRFNPPQNVLIAGANLVEAVEDKFKYLDYIYSEKCHGFHLPNDSDGVYDPRIRMGYHCPHCLWQKPREDVEERKDH